MNIPEILEAHLRKFWIAYSSAFTAGLVALVTGFFNRIGEWFAGRLERRDKTKALKEKIVKADSRDKLHDFMAREMVKVNDRLDGCEKRHRERDAKESQLYRDLKTCAEKKNELEVTNAKLRSEYQKAALENSILSAKVNSR